MADRYTKADPAVIRKIRWVARQQGMDSDQLHARCAAVTGQEHLSQLTVGQAGRLLDDLQGKQGGYVPAPDTRPLNRASQAQINKILAIGRKMGWVKGKDKSRLQKFLRSKHSVGVERLDWLTPDQANTVTEQLKGILKEGRNEREGYGDGSHL